jgi:hypothetical protein
MSIPTENKLASLLTSPDRDDPATWFRLCPALSIDIVRISKEIIAAHTVTSPEEEERQRKKLVNEGYALVDNDMEDPKIIQRLHHGIVKLEEQNLPATLILLFDAAWELAGRSRRQMQNSTHSKNSFNFDLLAWYVKPGTGGFSPHRDRQPSNAKTSFHSDGQAKFVTQWIALSEATPENSCLHVIPKPQDPGYLEGDAEEEDPLRLALPTKQSFQTIRALPRKPGQSILFTHRIIHWGSQSDADSKHPPRVAISFVCSDPEYEAPLVNPDYFTDTKTPPFSIRLLLVCAQLLIYYQRFELSKDVIKACYDYCKEHENELEETYRRKVFVEFVKAMKEVRANETTNVDNGNKAKANGVQLVVTEKGEYEDEEDAVMEEMLNAEVEGYGEFEDDYDELEEYNDGYAGRAESEDESEEEGVSHFGKKSRNAGHDEEVESEEESEEEGVSLFGKKHDDNDDDQKPAAKRRRKAELDATAAL